MTTKLIALDYENTNAPGARWLKSADSDLDHSKDSVGFAHLPDGTIGITQTKDSDAPVNIFTPLEIAHMLSAAKSGSLDGFAQG
jgi:hypothetical protein